MPARSKVAMLPDELRTELERRMAERSFQRLPGTCRMAPGKGLSNLR
jgi:hypothetical protein